MISAEVSPSLKLFLVFKTCSPNSHLNCLLYYAVKRGVHGAAPGHGGTAHVHIVHVGLRGILSWVIPPILLPSNSENQRFIWLCKPWNQISVVLPTMTDQNCLDISGNLAIHNLALLVNARVTDHDIFLLLPALTRHCAALSPVLLPLYSVLIIR